MDGRIQVLVQHEQDPRRVTICVAGELDIGTLPQLRDVLVKESRELPAELRVGLRRVNFLGAAAIGLLAATSSRVRLHGCRVLIEANPHHARLFRTCGLGHLLREVAESDGSDGGGGHRRFCGGAA